MRHAYVDTAFGQNYYETAGSGFPLFLLHQADTSSFEFENAIPLLAKKFRVIALDTPGFGRSDPAPRDWKLEDFARNVIAVMDALGIEKAHVAGHHTGGVIAVEVAAAFPGKVAKLVLSGVPIYRRDETWRQRTAHYRKLFAETAMPFPSTPPNDLLADGSHLRKLWDMQVLQNVSGNLEFVQKCFVAMLLHFDKRGGSAILAQMEYDRRPRLPLIKAPTLCLCGTQDSMGPPFFEPVEVTASLIPGAVHQWIEGGGIGVDWEMPEQWVGPILEFLG
jgi:pimeloyl-ACP methyl ester carboxylesterase